MKKGSSFFLIFVFVLGLSLLLYPTVSDYWNQRHQTRAIGSYTQKVSVLDQDEYDHIWQQAHEYNADSVNRENPFVKTEYQDLIYSETLNIDGSGIMGYVEIPSIDCDLPIYHGTSSAVLQRAVGHLDWTSVPVGGESTHAVLSGHRGLPSAKLFTNLNNIVVGDLFMIRILDETLTYEVDQILTVLPEDTSAIQIVEGEDLCTLVTCTPYGINTHRLLVRGHRVDNIDHAKTIRISADAIPIAPIIVAPIVAVPLLILLFTLAAVTDRRRKIR